MQLPSEIFASQLNHPEFRLIVSLYHLSDSKGNVDVTMSELEVLTGMSHEAQRRALRGLEDAGLITTTRTKRNLGKLYKNVYKLTFVVHENVEEVVHESVDKQSEVVHENEGSTAGHVSCGTNKLSKSGKPVAVTRNTSYFLVRAGGANSEEIVVGRWNPEEDDGIAGVGLFEDEILAGQPKPKVDKRKSNTRHLRPEAEWTANDVATEFAARMSKQLPYTSGMVNIEKTRGALLKFRADYNTTAEIEMAIMRMFFENEHLMAKADAEPYKAHTLYLGMFKSHVNKALEQLGYDKPSRVSEAEPDRGQYIYASDGREFDNSIAGRKMRELYEGRLTK